MIRTTLPARVLALALATTCGVAAARSGCEPATPASADDVRALVVTPTGLSVDTDGGHRVVTTLATVKDPLAQCFSEFEVEVQYFDADKVHVDTVTQSVEVPLHAGEEVAFRVRDAAARDKSAYASQTVRVVSAVPMRLWPHRDGLGGAGRAGKSPRGLSSDVYAVSPRDAFARAARA